jgi:uncharacterized damage-inducible protein DinB
MKDSQLMFAKYAQRANAAVFALVDGLGEAARHADRKSHYGSIEGLACHVLGGTLYMQSLIRASVPAAVPALKCTEGLHAREPKQDAPLDAAAWKAVMALCAKADQATVDMVASLSDKDLDSPVKLNWYEGNPPSVPLRFMLHQLLMHGTHHRGQLSQILDELGVEHDFSGIDVDLLPTR